MPALTGMGALRSSTTDLLAFVGANAGLLAAPLYPAMRAAHRPRTGRSTRSASRPANSSPSAGMSSSDSVRTSSGITAPPVTAAIPVSIRMRGAP
jgi:hypothetical protein